MEVAPWSVSYWSFIYSGYVKLDHVYHSHRLTASLLIMFMMNGYKDPELTFWRYVKCLTGASRSPPIDIPLDPLQFHTVPSGRPASFSALCPVLIPFRAVPYCQPHCSKILGTRAVH